MKLGVSKYKNYLSLVIAVSIIFFKPVIFYHLEGFYKDFFHALFFVIFVNNNIISSFRYIFNIKIFFHFFLLIRFIISYKTYSHMQRRKKSDMFFICYVANLFKNYSENSSLQTDLSITTLLTAYVLCITRIDSNF